MSVNITIQETINEVDITVNQNVITVNVTRTTGGGGVQSVGGDLVDNTDPSNPIIETPNLTQVLTEGDLSTYTVPIPNNTFVTFDLGRELTENYFTTDDVGTGGVFLDKDVVFPENSKIRFQAGYVENNVTPTNVTLLPYRFTTDAYVFYQGAIVTDITIQPEDVCTLKWGGNNSTDGIQIWFLSIVSRGSGSSPQTLAETLAIDNKTNQIPITSNDGTSTIQVDNDGNLYLQSNFGGLKQILITEEEFAFQSNIRYDINGKGVLINTNSDGFGLPRLTTTQMNAIVSPTNGMIVWNTTETATYQYNGTVWVLLGGTVTNVSGTTDEITVSNPTTTPVVGISSNYTTARNAYADAKVADNLTASTTVAPSKTAVNTALDLKVDKTSWVDYSASSTVIGWSSFTTKKISYKIIDNAMIVDFYLEGTSNATTISFTIPSNAAASSFVLSAYIINLGGVLLYPGRINSVAGSNVITIQRDSQNGPFTASGLKRCSGQIIIQL